MASRELRKIKQKNDKEKPHVRAKDQKKKPVLMLFSVGLLAIIVITFVGAPLAGRIGQKGRIVFGKYKGEEILFVPGNYLSRQSEIIAEQIRANSEDQNIQYQAYQVWRTAFERTVLHVAILQEAKEAGLHVTDEKIDIELTKTGPYVVNGKFSTEAYQSTSVSERTSTRYLFRENLIHQQYLRDVLQDKKESSKELDFIKEMAKEERSFAFVDFTFDDYPEEMILDFGRENLSLFREVKLSRITINSSGSDAENIHQQLVDNPGMFEELARTQSKDSFADKGGDMGWRSYFSLEQDFENEKDLDLIFSLQQDEISPVIETDFGWVIYRSDDAPRDIDLLDSEALERVTSYIRLYEGGLVEDYLLSQADAFRADAMEIGFESAAIGIDKFQSMTDYAPINYGNNFFFKPLRTIGEDKSALMQQVSNSEDFFKQGFSLEEDGISEPIIVDDTILVVKLLGVRTADDADLQNLDFYYPYIVQQFNEEDMNSFFLKSKDLEDNFNDVFYEYFLPR